MKSSSGVNKTTEVSLGDLCYQDLTKTECNHDVYMSSVQSQKTCH